MKSRSVSKHVQARRKYWQHHVEQWLASGLTQKRYSDRHDLNTRRLSYWKNRLLPDNHSSGFVAVPQEAVASVCDRGKSVQLAIDTGLSLKITPGFDGRKLQQILDALLSC